MKKILSDGFMMIVLCLSLVFTFAGCVSPGPYFEADAADITPPPGYARITQSALAGMWQSTEGELFGFDNNIFQSSIYNERKPGRYVINPVFDSYLLVFYRDMNVEGQVLYGATLFFDESRNLEKRNLDSVFAYLSEDRNTLVLGETTYSRVGN